MRKTASRKLMLKAELLIEADGLKAERVNKGSRTAVGLSKFYRLFHEPRPDPLASISSLDEHELYVNGSPQHIGADAPDKRSFVPRYERRPED